jgi:predicted acylesterase/phospholipase RssA
MELQQVQVLDTSKFGKYALILTGGGAAGRVQAGMLTAFAQAGVVGGADLITGTSVGSLDCGLFALFGKLLPEPPPGMPVLPAPYTEAVRVWEAIKKNQDVYYGDFAWWRVVADFFGALSGARSMLDRRPLKDLLARIFKNMTLEELYEVAEVHVCVMLSNLNLKEVEFFSSWDPTYKDVPAVLALTGSSGIPGVFDAVKITLPKIKKAGTRDHWFVDGGLVANNPFAALDEYNKAFPGDPIRKAIVVYCYPDGVSDTGVNAGQADGKDYSSFKDALLGSLPTMMNGQEQMLERHVDLLVRHGICDVLAFAPDFFPCDPLDFTRTDLLKKGYGIGVKGMGWSYRDKAEVHIKDFLAR